jgi:hypothetical protein
MSPPWNKIEFEPWSAGDVGVTVNNYGEEPIVLGLLVGETVHSDPEAWLSPEAARELARKLVEAADATDRAGRTTDV